LFNAFIILLSCSDHVVKKANIATTSTGNDIATFREVSALSPRGRYDIKFYPTFVHLHGKTFDYKVDDEILCK
jgi:structure-specific recognition protein 1